MSAAKFSTAVARIDAPDLLASLIAHQTSFPPETTVEEGLAILRRDNVQVAAVVEQGGVLGTFSLDHVDELLATRFGFALYAGKSVREALSPPTLHVVNGAPIHEVLDTVISRDQATFHQDILLLDRDRCFIGFIAVRTLVQLQHELLDHKLAELAQARDRALDAARTKSEFLANMSHEIRTPMNGVIGMANLLLETALTDDQRDLAQTLCQSGESLLTIINDILDFSKVEGGHLVLEHIDFDLSEQLQIALDIHAGAAARKGLELILDLPPDLPARLRGDPIRLRQVLLNLIGNAIKFTEHGEVVVALRLVGSSPASHTLRIEISDTGLGIAPAVQATLFQPFVQADTSTTRRFGGTGLGLAICRRLVALMHGTIGLASTLGSGSTFWFVVELGHPAEAAEPAAVLLESLAGRRALIVDDNATNRQVLTRLCTGWGLDHLAVDSATAALDALRCAALAHPPFDLVILDHHMPDIDGLQLARLIDADRSLPPVARVLLTSRGEQLNRADLDAYRVAACENKPVRPEKLRSTLLRALSATPPLSDAPDRPVASEAPRRGLPRILIAEDNPVNQKVTRLQLRTLGYHADVVSNGRQVLEALQARPYALVLMDQQMPEMDGVEATRQIRAAQAAGDRRFPPRLPIIAMTAHAMAGDREAFLDAGMDDYLAKPVRTEAIRDLLERHLAAQESGAADDVPEN